MPLEVAIFTCATSTLHGTVIPAAPWPDTMAEDAAWWTTWPLGRVAARDAAFADHDAALHERQRVPGPDHDRDDLEPLAGTRAVDEVERERHGERTLRRAAVGDRRDDRRQAHRVVGERGDQPAVREPAAVAVDVPDLDGELQRTIRPLRVDRLPGRGEGTLAVVLQVTRGNHRRLS